MIAAAKRGATAVGYEINPLLYAWSLLRTRRYRKQITIYLRSYWRAQLPPADVIYTFLITHHMKQLDAKLSAELSRPARVVSYVFELPRKAEKQNRNTFLYKY